MNLPSSAQDNPEVLAEWVDARLTALLMGNAGLASGATASTIPAMYFLLRGTVDGMALGLWCALALAVIVPRYLVVQRYRRLQDLLSPEELSVLWKRYRWLWAVSALVWGSSLSLYFDRSSVDAEFVCLMIFVAMGILSVSSISADLRCFSECLAGFWLSSTAVILLTVLRNEHPVHFVRNLSFLLLGQVFFTLIFFIGNRFHRVQRSSLELQFRNLQLIQSLTGQTRAALEAVDTKNRFLANAAHDLRQPVHALRLYADWLRAEPAQAESIAPKIVEATQAVNTLFDALFDLDRLDTGKVQVQFVAIDLQDLVHELQLQYHPLAMAKGLQLRTRGRPGGVTSDAILLRRILGNLLANAIKYTERGGVLLAVRSLGRKGHAIEIWDTGVGIAAEHQQDIFREFYKVPSHRGTEDGFGLGLSIVLRLTTILGHRLTLRSRLGRGSVFRLEIGG